MRTRLMTAAATLAAGTTLFVLGGCEAVLGLGSLKDAPADASTSGSDGSSASSGSSTSSGSSGSSSSGSADAGVDAHPQTDGGVATIDGGEIDANTTDGRASDGSVLTNCTTPCAVKTGLNNPWALTSDANRVYWVEFGSDQGTSDGVVASCPLAGCDSGEIVYSQTQINPRGIAVDANNVYWGAASYGTANGGIFSCPISGCTGAPTRVATASIPWTVQVDDTYVYWVDNDADTVNKVLKTRPTDGGAAPSPFIIYDGGSGAIIEPYECVVDSTSIYVTDYNGSAERIPLTGGEPSPYDNFQGPYGPEFGLALDPTHLYFGVGGEIDSTLKTAGIDAGVTLASDVSQAQSLALDPSTSFLYWANPGSGTQSVNDGNVGRVLTDGGSEKLLATLQAAPRGVTVSGGSVFWVNFGTWVNNTTYTGNAANSGSIYRVAK